MEPVISNNRFLSPVIRQRLKNLLSSFAVFSLLIFLLLHPAESLICAKAGMTLWLNTLLPALLPFIILTEILTHINNISEPLSGLGSFFHILLGVSSWGGYIFLLGMLCGYPVGVKLTSDLYAAHRISKKEALYLTTFCNNPSPAFIITYLSKTCLKDIIPVRFLFASIFISGLLCMLFFRFFIYKNPGYRCKIPTAVSEETACVFPHKSILDISIMNGFETITRLGGYILLFSILTGCIRYYQPFPVFWQYLFLAFTEITTGLSLIASSGLPALICAPLSVAATASGGLCILAQTRSVLHPDLSLLPYVLSKCMNALLSAGILCCFLRYI